MSVLSATSMTHSVTQWLFSREKRRAANRG
jgi:hypothetical protein